MEQNNTDAIEIDLLELGAVLMRRVWLILLVAVVAGASAFAFSRFVITPVYESQTQVYILSRQNSTGALTYSDVQLGTQLTKDYAQVVKSRFVIEQVIGQLGLDVTYDGLVSRVVVETPSDTRILSITVSDPSPTLAKELADEIRNVASQHITSVMDIEAVNVVDEGNLPVRPSEPSVPMWTVLGFLIGAFLTAAVVLVRYLLDDTIKSSEDVERYLGLSTLALIPVSLSMVETDTLLARNRKKKKREKPGKTPAPAVAAAEPEEESPGDEIEITDLTGREERA